MSEFTDADASLVDGTVVMSFTTRAKTKVHLEFVLGVNFTETLQLVNTFEFVCGKCFFRSSKKLDKVNFTETFQLVNTFELVCGIL